MGRRPMRIGPRQTSMWTTAEVNSNPDTKGTNEMMWKLLIMLIMLSLSGCVTTSGKGDLPESDLDVLEMNVAQDLKRTFLPNGKEYCAEDAATGEEQDSCLGYLEDALYLSNQDKDRARSTLHRGIQRLKLVRNPCSWLEKLTRNPRCTVK